MASASVDRNEVASVRYFARNPPPEALDKKGILTFFTPVGATKEEYKKARHMVTEPHDVLITDARTGLDGGLSAWNLDTHGFKFIRPPKSNSEKRLMDWADKERIMREYYPELIEIAKQHTGAKDVFILSYAVRTENPLNNVVAYAGFAHTDAGPGSVEGWRRALVNAGVAEEEAKTCDICMFNIWHPVDRPAFQNPLCLLDASSRTPGFQPDGSPNETVKYRTAGPSPTQSKEKSEGDSQAAEPKEKDENGKKKYTIFGSVITDEQKNQDYRKSLMPMRIYPKWMSKEMESLKDPFGRGPLYEPQNRWVYVPDMGLDEAWLFKQYDTREGVVRSTYHTSFHNKFHEDKPKETHGRRSVEFRMLFTFPKQGAAVPSSRL